MPVKFPLNSLHVWIQKPADVLLGDTSTTQPPNQSLLKVAMSVSPYYNPPESWECHCLLAEN